MSDVNILIGEEDCKHKDFSVYSRVIRLTDTEESEEVTGYRFEVTVQCAHCLKPFIFDSLPEGYHFSKPTTDLEKTELRIPIKPLN